MMHILPNISRSKSNETIRFCGLIAIPSFKNNAENETGRLVPNLFLFLKKALFRQKQVINTLVLIYFSSSWLRHTIKTNCIKFQTVDPEILEKSPGLVSPHHIFPTPYFPYGFSTKVFLILYSINLPNFIVWLLLHFEILGIICIRVICFPVSDTVHLEFDLNFPFKSFFYMTKTFRTKIWIFRNLNELRVSFKVK